MTGLKIIFVALILFLIANFGLWKRQGMYFEADLAQLKTLKENLVEENKLIESQKSEIDTLAEQLKAYDTEIKVYEKNNLTDQLNAKVNEYNSLLANYNAKAKVYESSLVAYNIKVDEVNSLDDKTNVRWYLLPLPVPGHEEEVQ